MLARNLARLRQIQVTLIADRAPSGLVKQDEATENVIYIPKLPDKCAEMHRNVPARYTEHFQIIFGS